MAEAVGFELFLNHLDTNEQTFQSMGKQKLLHTNANKNRIGSHAVVFGCTVSSPLGDGSFTIRTKCVTLHFASHSFRKFDLELFFLPRESLGHCSVKSFSNLFHAKHAVRLLPILKKIIQEFITISDRPWVYQKAIIKSQLHY